MPSRRRPLACAALAALLASGCGASTDVLGRSVTLVPTEEKASKVKGELLAVDQGRIWVRTKDGVRDLDPASLREVRVRRHNRNGAWAVTWGLAGGLASGAALTIACRSVEGNDTGNCARVGVGSAVLWTLVGLLAAPSLEASSQLSVDPQGNRLRLYSRFPAGLPPSLASRPEVQGPPAPR